MIKTIDELLSDEGRVSRKKFWQVLGISFGIMVVINFLSIIISVPLYVLVIPLPFLFLFSTLTIIKRFHDRNKSGYWVMVALIPFGIFWVIIECGFLKGTIGPNRFGEDSLASIT